MIHAARCRICRLRIRFVRSVGWRHMPTSAGRHADLDHRATVPCGRQLEMGL